MFASVRPSREIVTTLRMSRRTRSEATRQRAIVASTIVAMVDRREEQEVVIEPAIEVAIETVDAVVSRSDAATLTGEARRTRRSALAEHASPRGSLPSLAAISAPTRADPDRPRSAIRSDQC